jgi:DNA-binding Xre family transcriptional regulator
MKQILMHQNTNEILREAMESNPFRVNIKLDKILEKRGLSQGDLHRLTGIRMATLNDLINGKKNSINLAHISVIMIALRISDMTEIFDIEFEEEVKERWEEEMEGYTRGLTEKMKEEVIRNTSRMYTQDKK